MLPLDKEVVLETLKDIIPKKCLDVNLKTFNSAYEQGENLQD